MAYTTLEICDFNEFMGLAADWNGLLSRSGSDVPFLRHEWLVDWWRHFGSAGRLAVVITRNDEGELVLAAPLMEVVDSRSWPETVKLQSMTNYHSYHFHIFFKPADPAAFDSFWDYLRSRPRRWDVLELQSVPAGAGFCRELERVAGRDQFNSEVWNGGPAPFLRISGTWDDYYKTLKAKFRSNMRNRAKRLGELGEVRFEVITGPSESAASMDEAFRIEQMGWKGEEGSAMASVPEVAGFYRSWADTAARNGWLRLSFLSVNGRRVAVDYSVLYNSRLYCMKIGFDPEFSPFSVGQMLCQEKIRSSFEESLVEYDFLGEASVQKMDWNPELRPNTWFFVYNRSISARLQHFKKFTLGKKIKELSNGKR